MLLAHLHRPLLGHGPVLAMPADFPSPLPIYKLPALAVCVKEFEMKGFMHTNKEGADQEHFPSLLLVM